LSRRFTTTEAPAAARDSAMARPIPRDAPVTMATFSMSERERFGIRSDFRQRLFKIFDQVGGVFEADGDADRAGSDVSFFEFSETHVVVRGVGGEHDERFDAAKAGGEQE